MKKGMKNSKFNIKKKKGLTALKAVSFFVFFVLALRRGKYLLAIVSFIGFAITGLDLIQLSPNMAFIAEWANCLYVPFCFAFYTFAYLVELIFPKKFNLL